MSKQTIFPVTVAFVHPTAHSNRLPASIVRVGGVEVARYVHGNKAQAESAKHFARTLAEKLTHALSVNDEARERAERERIALTLLPAIVIDRALARHTSDAVGTARAGFLNQYEEAMVWAAQMMGEMQADAAQRRERAPTVDDVIQRAQEKSSGGAPPTDPESDDETPGALQ